MALVLGSAPAYNQGGKDLNGELGQRIDRLLTDNPVAAGDVGATTICWSPVESSTREAPLSLSPRLTLPLSLFFVFFPHGGSLLW
jgi:hypothetical protein